MYNLVLPLNFGDRPCDRLLTDSLGPADQPADEFRAAWYSLRIWKDFAIARDDRRRVPLAAADRRASAPVRVLERYAGWTGAPGMLVEKAIESGFFTLASVSESEAELVLTDFYPANRVGATDITAAKLGGASKSVNSASTRAKAGADEQLEMFKRSGHAVLKGRSETQVKEGMFFIHRVCVILHKQAPQAEQWKEELLGKALAILARFSPDQVEKTFRWFVIRRDEQEFTARLDFLLDQFPDFVDRAGREMPS